MLSDRYAKMPGVTEENPNLIDTDTGDEYEWVDEPLGGGEPGYAHIADHDAAWPREDLERESPLVEVDSLEPAELARLRQQWNTADEEGV